MKDLLLTHPVRGLGGQLLFLGRLGSRREELNVAGEATDCKRDAEENVGLRCICPGREAVSRVQRPREEMGQQAEAGEAGASGALYFPLLSQQPTASMVSCAPPAAK